MNEKKGTTDSCAQSLAGKKKKKKLERESPRERRLAWGKSQPTCVVYTVSIIVSAQNISQGVTD